MRLSINDEQVSYSLEHERTLGEVVRGVQSWLASAGFVITGLSADGSDLLAGGAAGSDAAAPGAAAPGAGAPWQDREVGAVSALAVKAEHTADLRISHWRAAGQWLAMLAEALQAPPAAPGTEDPLTDLLEDLPRTAGGFDANPFARAGSEQMRRFRAAFDGVPAGQVRAWTEDRRREALAAVQGLQEALDRRLREATHPEEALGRAAEALRASMGELKEVSLLLQTGRDRPAMEAIVRFTDVAQSVMDLLPFLPPDLERSRLFAELTPVLRELVGAFDSRDSVLIGDLLEYEVAPRMEKIAPLLGRTR